MHMDLLLLRLCTDLYLLYLLMLVYTMLHLRVPLIWFLLVRKFTHRLARRSLTQLRG